MPSIPASCAISGYIGLIGTRGLGGLSNGINLNFGASCGGGAPQGSNSSKSVSSIVISSSKNSSSDATGTEGLAGGSGIFICSVCGISNDSISSMIV